MLLALQILCTIAALLLTGQMIVQVGEDYRRHKKWCKLRDDWKIDSKRDSLTK